MKPFPLECLLRLRQTQQDEAAGALAGANRHLRATQARRANTLSGLAGTSETPAGPEALMAIAAARSSTRSMLTELQAAQAAADIQATLAQEGFNQAKAASMALEKLAGRHHTAEVAHELDTEQKALDEISVNTHGRTSKSTTPPTGK